MVTYLVAVSQTAPKQSWKKRLIAELRRVRGAPWERKYTPIDARTFGFGYDVTVRPSSRSATGKPMPMALSSRLVLPPAFVWREVAWPTSF